VEVASSTNQGYVIWVLLHQARDALYNASEKELRQQGISTVEAAAVFIIKSIGDRATPAEISRWLYRKQHSTSGLLKRMEKKGLVTKTNDLDRKNLVRVSLTEKGEQVYEYSTKRESIHRIIEALSEEECVQLASYLRTVRDKALEENGEDLNLPFP